MMPIGVTSRWHICWHYVANGDEFDADGSQHRDGFLDAMYRDLLTLLYEISFLGLVRRRDDPAIFSHETSSTVVPEDILNAHAYEIHPAFWRALQIKEDYKN